jgi:transcriptional regulator with XRE-family HTH domain
MAKISSLPSATGTHLLALGGRIRIARKRRGLSAQALAEKVGVFRKTIQALAAGKPGVSVGVLITVFWVLGLDAGRAALAKFDRIVAVVQTWPDVFRELGVPRRDIEADAPAFPYSGLFAERPVEPPPV